MATILFFLLLTVLQSLSQDPLSQYVNNLQPYLPPFADYSEQNHPVYLGPTPREMVLNISLNKWKPSVIPIPIDLQGTDLLTQLWCCCCCCCRCNHNRTGYAERQLAYIFSQLVESGEISADSTIVVEGWPVVDGFWLMTWGWARFREPTMSSSMSFLLLEPDPDSCIRVDPSCDPDPVFPQLFQPFNDTDFSQIFADFLTYNDLYQKPVFGDCIWAIEDLDGGSCEGSMLLLMLFLLLLLLLLLL